MKHNTCSYFNLNIFLNTSSKSDNLRLKVNWKYLKNTSQRLMCLRRKKVKYGEMVSPRSWKHGWKNSRLHSKPMVGRITDYIPHTPRMVLIFKRTKQKQWGITTWKLHFEHQSGKYKQCSVEGERIKDDTHTSRMSEGVVSYESIKREVKTEPIYECRQYFVGMSSLMFIMNR